MTEPLRSSEKRYTCLQTVGPDQRGCGLVFASWNGLKEHEKTHAQLTSNSETIEQAFRRLYIARFVERGLTAEDGAASFDAVDFEDIDDMTPEEAADEELSYWSDDGE